MSDCCQVSQESKKPGERDLVIIGGGSAAFAAAIRAAELGATVTMVNDGLPMGGTCVNVGCVPSQALIRAADAHHKANNNVFRGIESSSRVVNFGDVVAQKGELVDSLRKAKYADVIGAYPTVEFVEGRGVLATPNAVRVEGMLLKASKIIVATGSGPWFPPIPGLKEVSPLTSTSAFELNCLPESLVVLGGRYVALECAQMFSRLGSRVTILQRSEHLLPTEDDDLTEALAGYLRHEGLVVKTGVSSLAAATIRGGVRVTCVIAGEERAFEAEKILCATGRRPATGGIGLAGTGVRLGKNGRIEVDEWLQTSLPGVYAAGDVVGTPAFVYTAAYEGKLAAENALTGNRSSRDYNPLPWVIFTDPQVAGVGLNEKDAATAGLDVEVSRLSMEHVPRALAARDTRGFIKLLKERGTDRLVGARILAPEGGEQVMEAALAIRHAIGASELAAAFHPYLTQSEAIKLAAIAFGKDVNQLSCCAS